jgi:2-oxoglutarate dehydrogenase E2 component (dihydrolipoamide succinyltransferase)
MSAVAAHRAATAFGYTAYVAAAVVAALARFPRLNATFTDDGIIEHREIHLGIAVAVPDGVLVPVIPRAAAADVAHLAPRIADLADRARAGTLRAGETSGGTFTITNHGMLGSLWATPIIHQPQVAILGIGAVERRVVALPGDAIAIRPRCYLSLSFDHRALDGALADRFLAAVRSTLEAPWPA